MKLLLRLINILLLLILSLNCDDDPIQYQLTTEVSPEGSGIVTPASTLYNSGTEVEVLATANEEYLFKNWSGDASGNQNPLKIIMADDKIITAVFEKVQYTLNIEVTGNGTVNQEIVLPKSSSKDYDSGTMVQLTAIPDGQWKFIGWSGDYESTNNPITIEINKALNLIATFELNVPMPLSMKIVGNGSVDQEWIGDPGNSNPDIRLTATPEEGWYFVHWVGILDDGFGDFIITKNPLEVDLDEVLTYINDEKNIAVTAVFQEGVSSKTYVPDDNFEQRLIDLGYDEEMDDYVLTHSLSRIEELNVSNFNIEDLTGIEDCISLQTLHCDQNKLENINLTNNIHLYRLDAQSNKLSELDLSSLGYILGLDIRNNQLSCVQINEQQLDQLNNPGLHIWFSDEGVAYSLSCN